MAENFDFSTWNKIEICTLLKIDLRILIFLDHYFAPTAKLNKILDRDHGLSSLENDH